MRPRHSRPHLRALGCLATVMTALVALPVGIARAVGPATQVTVAIYSSQVQVGGSTQVTATVTDATGSPVAGDEVDFGADGGQTFSGSTGTTDSQGRVTVKVTATTKAGTYTITATDPSSPGGVSGHAPFTQTPGPPATMTLTGPNPDTVLADGRSTTSVVATLSDQYGNLISGKPVTFSTSDGGDTVTPNPPRDNGDGTYSAQITSSLTPGTVTITATDTAAPSVTATGSFTQSPWPVDHIAISLAPTRLAANGVATAVATVTLTDAGGRGRYGDADALALEASDSGLRIGPLTDHGDGTYTATVTASKLAHTVTVFATERATGLQATARLAQLHGPARTLHITLVSPVMTADGLSSTKAFVRVLDATGNVVAGDRIRVTVSKRLVAVGAVHDHHNGNYAVMLSSRTSAGRVTLTAIDTSVHPAVTSHTTLTVVAAPALATHVTMIWSFRYTPWWTYFRSFYLLLNDAPAGARLSITCRGSGCPYGQQTTSLPGDVHCSRCRVSISLGLTRPFVQHLLTPGTVVTAAITRRGWSGKYYSFTIERGQQPAVTISCLAPGASQPGVGCN